MKVVVAQRGAREHYLAARALARSGQLAALFTDWYAPKEWLFKRILLAFGQTGRRMCAAKAEGVHDSFVMTMRWRTIFARLVEKFSCNDESLYEKFLRADVSFARQLAAANLPNHDVIFVYSYAALEAIRVARSRGILTVLDQIDPGPVEFRLVAAEQDAWPQYALGSADYPKEYYERLRQEWSVADVIIVNSEWSRDALIAEGVREEKIEILPLGYENNHCVQSVSSTNKKSLRVLWLGQVNIRKGIQYLVEAARLLKGSPVEIVVAGPIQIRSEVIASAPNNIQWLGPVTRDSVGTLYASSDVFVLPTISDGFAITQLEAMAHGLPVITTTHCGQVVQDGLNGFVIPSRSAEALAEAILRFVRDRKMVSDMKPACLERSRQFGVDVYQQRLLSIIENRLSASSRA